MDPTRVAQLLGIHAYSEAPLLKKAEDLPYWIDQAIKNCKSGDATKTVQRESLPLSQESTSDETAHLLKSVEKNLSKEPTPIDKELQEIDEEINALKDSPFQGDIKSLEVLKFFSIAVHKLQELKWAIKTNPSFQFPPSQENNPLIKLIEIYYKTLDHPTEKPSSSELLENPQELAFGKMRILDKLLNLLSSHKNKAQELVDEAELKRTQEAIQKAKRGDVSVAKNIKTFYIKNQLVLVSIAKSLAALPSDELSAHIGSFAIKNEADRIEIAKILATKPVLNFCKYVANFSLSKENLFEVAKLAAQTPRSYFCEYVANFPLTKEELFEVAKLAAQTSNSNFCKYVANFPLTKEELFEVAVIAAKTRFSRISAYIKNFRFSNEIERIELAKIAVKDYMADVCEFIQEFQITNEQARIEIAMIAAMTPGSQLPPNIRNFQISKEEDRIALAKRAAKSPHKNFSEYFKEFQITNQNAIFEIAKMALKTTKGQDNYSKYNLEKSKVTCLALLKACYIILVSNEPLDSTTIEDLEEPFLTSKDYGDLPEKLKAHFEKLEGKLATSRPQGRVFFKTNLQFQKCLYLFLYESASDKEHFTSLSSFILKILDFRNKEVALESALAFSFFIPSPSRIATYQKNVNFTYMSLPMMFFAKIALEAEMPNALAVVGDKLSSIDKSIKTDDAKLTPLLKTLIAVESDNSLSSKEKMALILQFLHSGISLIETMKTLGVLSAAKLLNHPDLTRINSLESLKTVFSSLLETHLFKFPDDQRIKNFATVYPAISESMRISYALETYTANILDLQDAELLQAIRSLITALCTESFPKMRYNPEKSPHLQAIDKTVLAKWASTANQTYQETLPPSLEAKSSDEFQDLFLCGTEVMDSCQRIDGTPSLVKCLPGYVLNGADQILAITDKSTGKIKSRSILRLLLVRREGNWTPVLYQEKIYPKESLPKDHQIALENMAKKRALELGLELYTASQNKKREESLESLGSPAPWEYVDAQEIGTTEKSQFSITQFQRVTL